MTPTEDLILYILSLVFVGCAFIACIGFLSEVLKRIYNKYIMALPEVVEARPANIVENRYANAHVIVIEPTVMVEPTIIDSHDNSEYNVIAVEICI